jgi:amino acid transporter
MSLFDKIYNFWEDEKRLGSVLFYMIATFLSMLAIGTIIGLFALPCVLASVFGNWIWLFLWFIAIPLCAGILCKLIEIVE